MEVSYRRHDPERTVLYQIVKEHLPGFLRRAEERGRGVPKYVRNAFERFLDCGILRKGFVRVQCPRCGYDTVVGFS
jgi:hypothetical protein